jgi:hypothetical protein
LNRNGKVHNRSSLFAVDQCGLMREDFPTL